MILQESKGRLSDFTVFKIKARMDMNLTILYFLAGILFNDYNHDWKVLRRFTLQALRDFGVGKSSLEEKIGVEIEATSKWFLENGQKPIDINSSVQKLIGNVIYGIVFGMR